MLNISSIFKRKKLNALKQLDEAAEREATALRNAAKNDAHVEAQITQLAAKVAAPSGAQRRFEMIVPEGYSGKARPVADTQAASVVALVRDGVNSLRAENATLQVRVASLETVRDEKAKTPPAPDMLKLAAAVFPNDFAALKRTVDAGQLSHRCERLFHLSGLGGLFPSLDVEAHRLEVGDPKLLHGMARATHSILREKTIKALRATL